MGNSANDVRYLDEWRRAPLTYRPGLDLTGAHTDHYEVCLSAAADEATFGQATDHLLRYHNYPPDVMDHVSDFSRSNRRMRVGDRIIQRVHLLPFVDVLMMNEVVRVTSETRRTGFACITTTKHDEIGQWSPQIEHRPDGTLWLIIDTYSRPNVPWFAQGIGRQMQLRAHRRGNEHFRHLITS